MKIINTFIFILALKFKLIFGTWYIVVINN